MRRRGTVLDPALTGLCRPVNIAKLLSRLRSRLRSDLVGGGRGRRGSVRLPLAWAAAVAAPFGSRWRGPRPSCFPHVLKHPLAVGPRSARLAPRPPRELRARGKHDVHGASTTAPHSARRLRLRFRPAALKGTVALRRSTTAPHSAR